jgi:pyridoxal phosphate enzyme (YggS family)
VWHYIGSIQRNKTRDIAEHFDWVQTVERDIIAKRLNDQRPDDRQPLNVLIQINIDDEDSKSGCLPAQLPELIATIKNYERLQLRGLMIIPAKTDTDAFGRTKQLFEDIKHKHPELKAWDTLSMGMSGDMQEAIAKGSTMVRVGTAIFGARA